MLLHVTVVLTEFQRSTHWKYFYILMYFCHEIWPAPQLNTRIILQVGTIPNVLSVLSHLSHRTLQDSDYYYLFVYRYFVFTGEEIEVLSFPNHSVSVGQKKNPLYQYMVLLCGWSIKLIIVLINLILFLLYLNFNTEVH